MRCISWEIMRSVHAYNLRLLRDSSYGGNILKRTFNSKHHTLYDQQANM